MKTSAALIISTFYFSFSFAQDPTPISLCRNGTINLQSNLSGSTYQWQLNTGDGFVNISDNSTYTGTNSTTLTLTNVPSTYYGYQYRAIVDGNSSTVYSLKFKNTWHGSWSNAWEISVNWSCGLVPDAGTDVIIPWGSVILSSNAIARTLTLSPGVVFTVWPGAALTLTH